MTIDAGIIAAALTASGALPASWLIQGILQILKSVPQFAGLLTGREKLFCFVASFLVVALAFKIGLDAVPPTQSLSLLGIVGVVASGFALARLSMAAYDDFVAKDDGKRPAESVLSAKGWTGK